MMSVIGEAVHLAISEAQAHIIKTCFLSLAVYYATSKVSSGCG